MVVAAGTAPGTKRWRPEALGAHRQNTVGGSSSFACVAAGGTRSRRHGHARCEDVERRVIDMVATSASMRPKVGGPLARGRARQRLSTWLR
eukprot:954370-Prymnesium_polylepis.1